MEALENLVIEINRLKSLGLGLTIPIDEAMRTINLLADTRQSVLEIASRIDALAHSFGLMHKLYSHLVKRIRDEYGIEIDREWGRRVLNGEHDVPLPGD